MEYVVIKKHRSNYPNPITLMKGQAILIGEKYEGPEQWNHWLFCRTLDEQIGGWVPQQLIDRSGTIGIIQEDYTAKELNVDEDDRVIGIKELNGWVWCRKIQDAEEGWVPKNHLKSII